MKYISVEAYNKKIGYFVFMEKKYKAGFLGESEWKAIEKKWDEVEKNFTYIGDSSASNCKPSEAVSSAEDGDKTLEPEKSIQGKPLTSLKGDNKADIGWYPLGRLPNWSRVYQEPFKMNKRVNRYISWQEKRIIKAVNNKEYNKATILWMLLLKSSWSYQLILFNQVFPQWHYILDKIAAKNLLKTINNKCRTNNLWLKLTRFYILKADGIRYRPIGCPDYPSRVISKSINNLIYLLFEDKFNENQHGFRRQRGVHTALFNLIQKLKLKPEIVYEFDLRSYFNTVRPSWVYRSLLARSSLLAEYVLKILCQITYTLPKEGLKKEKELHYKGIQDHYGAKLPLIYREGLPQGLSISPLLSTLAMETFKFPKELIMYADDGVFTGPLDKFKTWLGNVSLVGVELAEEKSRIVEEEFKFLGCIINLKKENITYENDSRLWTAIDLEPWLRKVAQQYAPKEKQWTWNIHVNSYTHWHWVELGTLWNRPIWDIILIFAKGIIWGEGHQGYRYFLGHGIIDFISASSEACNEIGKIKHELNLLGIKPLRPIFKNKFGDWTMIKGKPEYFEEIYENNLRAWIQKNPDLKGWNNVLENYFES